MAIFEDATKEFEIDQMKSEFVALASHQLKTPLTVLRAQVGHALMQTDLDTMRAVVTRATTGHASMLASIARRMAR